MPSKTPKSEQKPEKRQAGRGARAANTHLIVEALRTLGPLSQAMIARQTGLSPASVNNIIHALRHDHVVSVEAINGREALVRLATTKGAVASVTVGPEVMSGALVSFDRERRFDALLRPPAGQAGTSPDMVVELLEDLARQAGIGLADLTGVAIAMQAPIERGSGAVTSWAASRLPLWRDMALQRHFAAALGVPVIVDNDANLAALAEWSWGAGRGSEDFLYVICSEQIGGGLIIDGKIYRGGTGIAGEIGHMVLTETGPLCFCGSRGCLSAYASERAILSKLQVSESAKTSLKDVIASARNGDAACQLVLHEAGRSLGQALANAARLIAPSVISIGGELGAAGAFVYDGLRSAFDAPNMKAITASIRVCVGELPGDATLLGGVAAVLASLDKGLSALPGWMEPARALSDR
ncbi:ROK family transcriptional regulator [Acidocella sp.]|uniref:ROK family transcriptional regulator n=1 Tax=Acidocella sp. TaxID=50710 RepID=UPI00260C44DC|nr:ROK family transcriptional regulator [Acidocella sp.]